MAVYIKRQWPRILGFTLPLFALLILVGVGVSIFPNSTLYGLPGEPCTFNFIENCDPCNGERCVGDFCANDNGSNFDPDITDLQCPVVSGNLLFPECWNLCVPGDITTGNANTFECFPDDQFCEDITGGNESNDCRIGTCTDDSTIDTNNPTGCDYDYTGQATDPLCMNCEDAQAVGFDNCGNGVCEVAEGEDCQTCAVDCLVPGFEDSCPVEGPVPACSVQNIIFPGPPYNVILNALEDGDICTNSTCDSSGNIVNTDKTCSQDTLDFCCPSSCMAPPDGLTCAEADAQGILPPADCDADCYIPEICLIPIPTPTPIPTPGIEIQGSGLLPCSLQSGVSVTNLQGMLSLLALGMALGGILAFRRYARGR